MSPAMSPAMSLRVSSGGDHEFKSEEDHEKDNESQDGPQVAGNESEEVGELDAVKDVKEESSNEAMKDLASNIKEGAKKAFGLY